MQAGPQDEAKLFISKGDIPAFEQHLVTASPTGAEQYVDLLEAIEIAPDLDSTKKECLFQSLFKDLECRQQAAPDVPPVKPSDAKAAALFNKGLDGDAGAASPVVSNASVSIFDVFRGCLQKDRQAGASAPRLADRIWEQQAQKGPYLLERGAIYDCAFYGNSRILKIALDVLDHLERAEPETKRLLYYNSHDEEKETPLEFALMHGDIDCVKALGGFSLERQGNRKWHMFADKAARRYMGTPVLHCALAYARQVILRPDGNPELAKNRAINLLERVITMLPDTLCQLQEVPEGSKTVQQTPLSNAREIANGDLQWGLPAKMIRSKIFEVFVGDPNSARRALYSPHEPNKEFALDLSDFNHLHADAAHFEDFVVELIRFSSSDRRGDLAFEDTFLYLVLPHLANFELGTAEHVMKRFLVWLKERGVKTIKELIIPDSCKSPLTPEFVRAHVLQSFDIESLDWKVLDISLDLLTENAPSLKEVTLYSSGNWSILYHWVSVDGLAKLKKLEYMVIYIVEPPHLVKEPKLLGTHWKNLEQKKKVMNATLKLQKSRGLIHFAWEINLEFSWKTFASQSEAPPQPQKLKVFSDFVKCHAFLHQLKTKDVKRYPQYKIEIGRLKDHPIKIAVIDNGTDRLNDTLATNISKGVSYARSSSTRSQLLPWYIASDAHGTQMAYLIRTINPHCCIYPIRVGMVRDDIQPKAAIQAIRWALKQDVDIISISWITAHRSIPLNKTLIKASKSALIFCTTADRGHLSEKTWPSTGNIIKVAASNAQGFGRDASEPITPSGEKADLMIDGDDISARGPCYMRTKRNTTISGSSVATALAAGIASLIMCLAALDDSSGQARTQLRRRKVMMRYFEDKMFNNKMEKVVVPSKLFDKDFTTPQGEHLPPVLQEFVYNATDSDKEEGKGSETDEDTESEEDY